MERIKCAVIGLGWFGEHHVDTLNSLPLADLTAVCTRTESRLKEIAEKYGVKKTYTDYKELLNDPEIEMVTITTHTKDHLVPAIDALKAGKHVFLEKPMSDTSENCKKIIAEVKKTDKCFMVGHICRFDTAYALAKEEIEAGNIGTILSMHAKRNLAGWITESHLQKVSAMMGDGVHDLDLMLWYSGSKPVRVYAQTRKTRESIKYDDVAWAMFNLDNGAIAVIENVWALAENVPYAIDAKMEIIGTKGSINIDNSGAYFSVLKESGYQCPQSTYWPKVHGMRRGFLKEEFDYFLKCVTQNKKPDVITPEESMQVIAALEGAEESAKTGTIFTF